MCGAFLYKIARFLPTKETLISLNIVFSINFDGNLYPNVNCLNLTYEASNTALSTILLEYACLFGASFLGERDYALYESSAGPVKEDNTSLEYPCIALSSLNSFRPSCKLGDAVYDESAGSSSPSPSLS